MPIIKGNQNDNVVVNQIESVLWKVCRMEGIPVVTEAFYCGGALEKAISLGTKYDIIYLDIHMKNGDGITTAKNIREMDENVLLIYVSGYDKCMIELFQLDIFAIMIKPIQEENLSHIFLEANRRVCSKMFYFSFRYRNQEYKIPCKDILYFESRGRKVNTYLQSGELYVFNGKLSGVEEMLFDGKIPFIRIHQSFLVNYCLIRSKSKAEVELINGIKLPISESRQKEFNRRYSKLLLGRDIDV